MSGLSKKPDWCEQLTEFLMSRVESLFQWGRHDCALMVCDGVEIMTGTDIAGEARGRYASEEGATEFLAAETGGGGLAEYAEEIAARHGMERVPLALARRGDVVLWNHPESGPTLGLVSPDGVYAVFAAPRGLTRHRVLRCERAWRVG